MDKNKILNLIGTGTAVGALLIIAMLFSNGGFGNEASTTSAAEPAEQAVQVDTADLEAQNAQLQEALTVMQQREAEYQARINEANDMLMNPEPAPANSGTYEGEEAYEEEDDEHEYEDEEEDEDDD